MKWKVKGQSCKNRFYLRRKWIDLRQTTTKVIIDLFCVSLNTFHQLKCFIFVMICNLSLSRKAAYRSSSHLAMYLLVLWQVSACMSRTSDFGVTWCRLGQWCDVMWCDVMWRDVTWCDVTGQRSCYMLCKMKLIDKVCMSCMRRRRWRTRSVAMISTTWTARGWTTTTSCAESMVIGSRHLHTCLNDQVYLD